MKSLLIATILTLTGQVYAQGPCLKDIAKFCPNIEKNKASMIKCIIENESKLSPACKERAKIIKEKSNRQNARKNSKNNVGTQVGAKPLDNQSKSKPEANKLDQKAFLTIKTDCIESIKAYCVNIKPKHGAVYQCLKSNMTKLTPKCKATISKI